MAYDFASCWEIFKQYKEEKCNLMKPCVTVLRNHSLVSTDLADFDKRFTNDIKILVIGPNGSGKSTLSKALGRKYGIPICHLDKLHWEANWRRVDNKVFLDRVLDVLEDNGPIIMDGDYASSLQMRLKYADMVIRIKMNPVICLINVLKRKILNNSNVREDMAEGCFERLKPSFLWKSISYKQHSGIQTDEVLLKYHGDLLNINGKRQLNTVLELLQK